LVIDNAGPVGRRNLSEQLEINDGVARGLLERLAEHNTINVTPTGVELSKKGKRQLQEIFRELSLKKIVPFDSLELTPGARAAGGRISKAYASDLTGVSQRDEAIKAGAMGAITVTVRDGKLRIPPDNKNIAQLAPGDNLRLLESFKPQENDVIVIGFARNPSRALAGMLAAIFSLHKPLRE
jgi:hypothetical protein